jgi:hypothetical protein
MSLNGRRGVSIWGSGDVPPHQPPLQLVAQLMPVQVVPQFWPSQFSAQPSLVHFTADAKMCVWCLCWQGHIIAWCEQMAILKKEQVHLNNEWPTSSINQC